MDLAEFQCSGKDFRDAWLNWAEMAAKEIQTRVDFLPVNSIKSITNQIKEEKQIVESGLRNVWISHILLDELEQINEIIDVYVIGTQSELDNSKW